MPQGNAPVELFKATGEQRLDSWKEIATFFGRDERTVKRWEKTRSLPIHRIPGAQRSGVFAYQNELTSWLNSTVDKETSPVKTPADPILSSLPEIPPIAGELHIETVRSSAIRSSWISRRWVLQLIAGGVTALICTAALLGHARRNISPHNDTLTSATTGKTVVHSAQAKELYLKGRYYWNRRTATSLAQAIDAFSQAIAIEPQYAEAYAGLADSYNLIREYTSMPDAEAYPRAIAAAEQAVSLDYSLEEAHRALAYSLFYWKWDFTRAFAEYQRAIELNPKDPDAYHWYATSLLCIGDFDKALKEIEHARTLNPASPSILADRALILFFAGDRSTAITSLQELEKAEPNFLSPPRYLARMDMMQGDFEDFLFQLDRIEQISKNREDAAILQAAKHGWAEGGSKTMLEAMDHVQQKAVESGRTSGFEAGYTSLLLGRKQEAVRDLQFAYAARDANMLSLERSPFERALHGSSNYEHLRRELDTYTGSKAYLLE
jgi:tetratricopeptide (TPR) repeat protein